MADYTLDWATAHLDGHNTLNGDDGAVGVDVSTPANHDHDSWSLGHIEGKTELVSDCVDDPTKVFVNFDDDVENVSFELFDIDSDNHTWDDRVTVIARDAHGNQVEVNFSDLAHHHHVNGNTVDTTGNVSPGVDGSGDADSVTVTIPGPIVSLEIIHDNGSGAHSSGTVGVSDLHFDKAETGDGIVTGTGGDDVIDVFYEDDPEGDMIDADDALLPGEIENDDIVLAGDGDDTVLAADGDDEVYGGAGSDSLFGGAGNDLLVGDDEGSYGPGPEGTEEVQEVFKWSELTDKYGGHLSHGEKIVSQSQDTGENTVTLTLDKSYDNTFATDQQKVHSIDTGDLPGANAHSSLASELDYKGESKSYTLDFDKDAANVSFRVNDIDYDSTVVVTAFDADGNAVPVDMTAGSGVSLQNNDGVAGNETAISNGGGAHDASPTYSALVSMPGPVSKIVITHTQDGYSDSGINVTDIYFDTLVSDGSGLPGDDVIDGGIGDDIIYGNDGDDVLTGGEGDDQIFGGADADLIKGGAGDTVDGGAAGDDHDVLDLTGEGPFYLAGPDGTGVPVPDSNGNGIDGTVIFVDGDGNPTGDMLVFTEIEEIIGDEVNRDPEAGDDTAEVDEDGSVDIPVLLNDTDADGDDLTVTGASADNGTVTINPDGTLTYEPDENFNGTDTITYTVDDGNGGTDEATVTVTVNPVNDDPVAGDDTAEVDEDGSVDIPVLLNDTDADGDDLTVTGASADNGTVTINPDGTLTYEPDENFNGTDTITYTVDDGNGGTDEATVTVTVNPVNDDPVAGDDTATTDFNTPVDIPVLMNDTDVDGDDLTVTEAASDEGDVTINPDGTITFEPDMGFSGEATITYTVDDGNGGTDEATVTVTVGDAPLDGTVEGTDGNDIIDDGYLGDPEGDRVDNNDAILPGDTGNDDLIFGFGGDDSIGAGDGDDEVYGGDGNDVIKGRGGEDTLSGDAGDDSIRGGADNDIIFGGIGNDTLDGEGNDDIVYGDEGDDTIIGGGGEDSLYGGDGNDSILGNNNNDVIDGGAGNDSIAAGASDDTVTGGAGDDTILGEAGSDSIAGNAGNDYIDGGDNADTLRGGDGEDTVHGGSGNDTAFGGDDNDLVDGGAGDDTLDGGLGDDTVLGGEGEDYITGGAGDDSIDGGDGNDSIEAGTGNDVVEGGDGDDFINAGNHVDPLPDAGYPGLYPADPVTDDDLDTVFGGAGNDIILTGDDDDVIDGGSGDDYIDAGFDDDSVTGGTGNDTIIGGEGNDEIAGNEGDDVIYGGLDDSAPDFVNIPDDIDGDGIDSEPGEDQVTDNNTDTIFGGDGNDSIFGRDDDDTLYGDAGNDYLDGGVDDDEIYGGDGEDTIIGGQGTDDQFGGLGSDKFIGGNGGDVVVGGEDPDDGDWDVLDLTGSNVDFITYDEADPTYDPVSGVGESGTVTFLDGSTMTFAEIENVIPCFTPGTTIATPRGERLVEELREGDRIITRDNGIQEIRWVGRKEMNGKALVANPHLKPILIKAGALGHGLPERDMLVSPNHRVLVAGDQTQLYFEESEVLAAAKHMVGAEGIHEVDVMQTTYIHFMFDRHEVVLSNGAWTESFQPGDYSLKGIGNSQRNELFELFPDLQTKAGVEGFQSARRSLKKHEARLLVK